MQKEIIRGIFKKMCRPFKGLALYSGASPLLI